MTTKAAEVAVEPFRKNERRTIFGWCMYDWANSAYMNTVAVVLLPVYFAQVVVGHGGARIGGTVYAADTLWAFMIATAAILAFLTAPVLGAVADFSSAKKRFLLAFAYSGALFTMLVSTSGQGDVLRTMVIFLGTQFCFVSANVFYDAFLPQIATDEQTDRVSARGYAFGYFGGGLHCALALALVAGHEKVGISQQTAVQIGLASAAVWWAGFALFTAKYLREPGVRAAGRKLSPLGYAKVGVTRTLGTIRKVSRFRHLALFLLAFMLYDDGIQTVILMATAYGTVELGLPAWALMLTVLLIQFVATGGALLFGRIAGKIGTKRTIIFALMIWTGVVVYAYFIRTMTEFFALGMLVGLVMGGSQALSRSFYASMVPEEASAEFFGFYTVFSKFSAIWGPLAFAAIKHLAGSSRLAIVSIAIFFIVGMILLSFVNEQKAREARASGAF